jgi:hypothetical protein
MQLFDYKLLLRNLYARKVFIKFVELICTHRRDAVSVYCSPVDIWRASFSDWAATKGLKIQPDNSQTNVRVTLMSSHIGATCLLHNPKHQRSIILF